MRVKCIHVPALVKGQQAVIHWEPVPGAAAYILERKVTGVPGLFPDDYINVALGDTAVEETLHTGMTWKEIRAEASPHRLNRAAAFIWKHVALLGQGVEAGHVAFTDEIPWEAEQISYRVKPVAQGDDIPWRDSAPISVINHAPSEDRFEVTGQVGESVRVRVLADTVKRYPGRIELYYNPGSIRLQDIAINKIGPYEQGTGKIIFQCTRENPGGNLGNTALIATLFFEVLKARRAHVYLR
jgi:hypothetical protein